MEQLFNLGHLLCCQKKEDKKHELLGNNYFYSMLGTVFFAMVLSNLHPNQFLILTFVLTIYMVLTGKSNLKKKKLSDVTKLDWFLTFAMLLFAYAFIGLGTNGIIKSNFFGILLIVFGRLSLLFVY